MAAVCLLHRAPVLRIRLFGIVGHGGEEVVGALLRLCFFAVLA